MCFQVQQNILVQVKQPIQAQATSQFSSQQDMPVDKVVITSSASTGTPAQLPSVLQPTSVLVKTPATGKMQCVTTDAESQETPQSSFLCNYLFSLLASSDLQVFSGAQGQAGAIVNQTVTPVSLTQPAQVHHTLAIPRAFMLVIVVSKLFSMFPPFNTELRSAASRLCIFLHRSSQSQE